MRAEARRWQSAGARRLLEEVLAVAASAEPTWSRCCYRAWLATPGSKLHRLLGRADIEPDDWHRHRVPVLRAQWHRADGGSAATLVSAA